MYRHIPQSTHQVLLGSHVRPQDFPATPEATALRDQLCTWISTETTRHHRFVSSVLAPIHDDGSHTVPGQTNRLAHLAGIRELRVRLAELLDIRVGEEFANLAAVLAAWPWPQPGGAGAGAVVTL